MPFNFNDKKIPIFPNVNDTPVAPTGSKAGNGSHLISVYNNLIDYLGLALGELEFNVANLTNRIEEASSAGFAFPVSHTHWHSDSAVFTGSELQNLNFADQPYSTVTVQEPALLNDLFCFITPLRVGYYKLFILGRTALNGGRFEIYLNDMLITSPPLDLYSDTPAPILFTVKFQVTASMPCVFFVKSVETSQTGYALPFTKFSIRN